VNDENLSQRHQAKVELKQSVESNSFEEKRAMSQDRGNSRSRRPNRIPQLQSKKQLTQQPQPQFVPRPIPAVPEQTQQSLPPRVRQKPPQTSVKVKNSNHPSVFLNQLDPLDQQKFLDQFSKLTREQQAYAYNQFLSNPARIQQHAIKQFLSLDAEVLSVSIQAEIEKESQRQGVQKEQVERRGGQRRGERRPSQAEIEALQLQKQQQRLQQQQLDLIIKEQQRINQQGQTIIM